MTRPPITTPQCLLLLDANVVLEAHRRDVWNLLLQRASIAVPSAVARDEARFYDSRAGMVPIHLPSLISDGKITEVAASAQQIESVINFFNPAHANALGAGELEALAILQASEEGILFCTADRLAIYSLVIMGFSERGISLEEVLRQTGLTKSMGCSSPRHFSNSRSRLAEKNASEGKAFDGDTPVTTASRVPPDSNGAFPGSSLCLLQFLAPFVIGGKATQAAANHGGNGVPGRDVAVRRCDFATK